MNARYSPVVTFEILVYPKDAPYRGEIRAEFSKIVEAYTKTNGVGTSFMDYDRIVADAARELKCGFDRISGQLESIAPQST